MYNVAIEFMGDGTVIKKTLIIGLAIAVSGFSVGCSTLDKPKIKNNIVVSAANNSVPKQNEIKKEEPKAVKLDAETKVEVKDKVENKEVEKKNIPSNEKEAFLTFDDGPTKGITSEILDILKQKQVKATFFVIGKMVESNKDILLREKEEGHAIANHSFSHDYKYLYADPNNFVEDINKADAELKNILEGYNSKLIRFPGGSFGKELEIYRQAITDAGYHYIDWNSLNGDAEGKGNWPVEKLVQNIKATSAGKNRLVILMHDAPLKQTTVQALPQIIDYLKSQGYSFKTLE
jgi:peptidoglycan/xylan/chitin deacetylase (PgdA/CDA1 family)